MLCRFLAGHDWLCVILELSVQCVVTHLSVALAAVKECLFLNAKVPGAALRALDPGSLDSPERVSVAKVSLRRVGLFDSELEATKAALVVVKILCHESQT